MVKKKIMEFRDPVIEQVVDKFVDRSDVGFKKYGITLDADPGDIQVWVNHIQEELMDAVNYLQKLQNKLEAEKPLVVSSGTFIVCQCCYCKSQRPPSYDPYDPWKWDHNTGAPIVHYNGSISEDKK